MTIANPHNLGKELVELFGLPKMTRSIQINIYVDDLVTVKCEYYLEEEIGRRLLTLFKKYRLEKIENTPERCEVCGKEAIGWTRDVYDVTQPGDTWVEYEPGEYHRFCKKHMRKSKIIK